MSATLESMKSLAGPALEQAADKIGSDLLGGFESILRDAGRVAREKAAQDLRRAGRFRLKAATSEGKERDDYLAAATTAMRAFKTTLLAEKLVAEERSAELLQAAALKAFDAAADVAGLVLGKVAEAAVTGLVAGIAKK